MKLLMFAVAAFITIVGQVCAEVMVLPWPCDLKSITLKEDDCADITIFGELQDADGETFLRLTKNIRHAEVDVSGPGGSVLAAIQIGERIHEKGYSTKIHNGTPFRTDLPRAPNMLEGTTICFSACALIWQAGKVRIIPKETMLMFHVPFIENDPDNADGIASVIVGIYLRNLGLDYNDATFIWS
jgi:hypothetical protein